VANLAAGEQSADKMQKMASRLMQRLKRRGHECDFQLADNGLAFEELLPRLVKRRPHALVVFGGSGSVRCAASRLLNSRTALGIIPCGRFNDIFRSLYPSHEPDRAADIVVQDRWRKIDIGRAGGKYFVGSLITGLVPKMIARNGDNNLPRMARSWSKLAGSATEDTAAREIEIKVDAFTFKAKPRLINLHVLSHVMTLPMAPAATPAQNRLVLLFDDGSDRDQISQYVKDIKKNRYQYTGKVQMVRGKRIAFSPVAGRGWLADGEEVAFSGDSLTVELHPGALRVFHIEKE
jgi:diacylglycerol kinase family enzyme